MRLLSEFVLVLLVMVLAVAVAQCLPENIAQKELANELRLAWQATRQHVGQR